jgi:tRNA pseudouridine38-40 synthase
MQRHRYALRLAYEGDAFRGFQRQPGLPTVQEALEVALRAAGVESSLAVAARTDAGVHAIAQVVSFAVRAELDVGLLRARLNGALPGGIACLEALRVDDGFHARASASRRRYVYLVGAPPPEGLLRYAWSLPDERAFPGLTAPRLDPSRMREALGHAVGTHDFAGFARGTAPGGTVKALLRAEVLEPTGTPIVAMLFEGTGFVRAMVRNLAGTAVAAGLGLLEPGEVREMLSAPRRYRGVRAPARGLTLVAVDYPPGRRAPGREEA